LDAEAGGGTDGIGGVAVGEFESFGSEAIDVWSLVEAFGVVGADVHVAEVIDHDEDVGFTREGGGGSEEK